MFSVGRRLHRPMVQAPARAHRRRLRGTPRRPGAHSYSGGASAGARRHRHRRGLARCALVGCWRPCARVCDGFHGSAFIMEYGHVRTDCFFSSEPPSAGAQRRRAHTQTPLHKAVASLQKSRHVKNAKVIPALPLPWRDASNWSQRTFILWNVQRNTMALPSHPLPTAAVLPSIQFVS